MCRCVPSVPVDILAPPSNSSSCVCISIGRVDVSLRKILHFISGSSKIPASGFDVTPKIRFTDDDVLPFSSTCDLSIAFPRSYGLLQHADFKKRVDYCISDSFGYGAP